jgi:microcystin degradation protein MlrC
MLWRPGQHPDQPTEATGPLWACRRRARDSGWSVVEGTCAYAMPGGPVPEPVYESLRDEILEQLRQALPVDIVALGLHGAMVADRTEDCEGDLLTHVRALVGPKVAVGAELDCHAHLTQCMQDKADVLVFFKEYPHTDYVECGEHLLDLLERTRRGEVHPVMHARHCHLAAGFPTRTPPVNAFVQRMRELERGTVLSVSLVHGFAGADVPDMGAQVLVVTDGDAALARQVSDRLAHEVFAMREALRTRRSPMEDVLTQALAHPARPVILADVDDNPGGGASGDNTDVIRVLLGRGVQDTCVGPLWDPVAVRMCFDAGVGARLALRIGGKVGEDSGAPLDVKATVTSLRENHAQQVGGVFAPLGDCAAIAFQGIEVVLCSIRDQAYDPSLFAGLGIDCSRSRFIVLKSAQQFRNGFDAVSEHVFTLRRPAPDGAVFQRIRRPMWPFDELTELPEA